MAPRSRRLALHFMVGLAVVVPRARAAAQDAAAAPACAPGVPVHRVFISLASDDTSMMGQRLPIRAGFPLPVDLTAVPDASGALWMLALADPAPADSLRLQLRIAGMRVTPLAPLRVEVRGGECVARAAYHLQRVWAVEVTSKPESLRVEERVAGDPTTPGETRVTPLSSREVPWTSRLQLRMFVRENESFQQELDPTKFRAGGDGIVLSRHDIADRMCEQHGNCPNMFARLLHGSLLDRSKLEEVRLRLVKP